MDYPPTKSRGCCIHRAAKKAGIFQKGKGAEDIKDGINGCKGRAWCCLWVKPVFCQYEIAENGVRHGCCRKRESDLPDNLLHFVCNINVRFLLFLFKSDGEEGTAEGFLYPFERYLEDGATR